MEFGIIFFKSGKHTKKEPYVNIYGEVTSKFGWVWFDWLPFVRSWVQFDTPTRRVRYIRACWLFFGIDVWKAN